MEISGVDPKVNLKGTVIILSKVVSVVVFVMAIVVKFVFSKKATKFDKILTVDLTLTTYCQIHGEYFINFCGLIRKHRLYQN